MRGRGPRRDRGLGQEVLALQDAASIAGLLVTIEALVPEAPEKTKSNGVAQATAAGMGFWAARGRQ
jgi:hypothetical protein